jgi:PAS domain S-box-containing protein
MLSHLNIIAIALPEQHTEYIQHVLGTHGYDATIKMAFDIPDIIQHLQHVKKIDLAFIHYNSSEPILKDIISYIKFHEPNCKILAFFEECDEESISNALKKGVDSFILGSRITTLISFLEKSKKALSSSKLSDKELIFNALLENTSDSIWAKDIHGRYILINSAGAEFLKKPIDEILGKDDTELFPIETAVKVRKSDRLILESGQTQTIEDTLTTPDGAKRTFQAVKNVYRDEVGKPQGIIGTVRDISLRKQVEEALRHSEERFRVLVESIKDYAIFMVSPDGHVSAWNIGAERLIGYHPSDIIGLNFSCLYTEEDQQDGLPLTHLGIALNRGRHETNRWLIQNSQDRFMANVVISPMYGDMSDLLGFSVIVKDLTEQKKAEDSIRFYTKRLEESNRDLEEFAFIASHDLQAPLRKVRMFSEMLSGLTNESGKEFALRLEKSTTKMQALITDLLALSRINRKGKPLEVVDLDLIISDALDDLEIMIGESDATITIETLGSVRGDASQLKQLFMNIINNSIKFRKKDEKPTISISTVALENGMKQITIKDNGTGFEPRFSERIFKPFERLQSESDYPGTGMGLAICKKIIDRHEGKIVANSNLNQGTTLEICLYPASLEAILEPLTS